MSKRNETPALKYQAQDSILTLQQGLDEYFAANPGLLDSTKTSSEALGQYMNNHDVSHVVFGTGTSLSGEMLQDTWTFLAIDVSVKQYVSDFVKEDEGKEIMKSTIQWEIIPVMIAFVFQLPRLAWRSRKMSKKWPWKKWQPYLDVPLAEIRREFGLKVI